MPLNGVGTWTQPITRIRHILFSRVTMPKRYFSERMRFQRRYNAFFVNQNTVFVTPTNVSLKNEQEVIELAELKLGLDDAVRRKKADTVSLVFTGKHDKELGEFKLTCKFDNHVPSYWKALLGDGNFSEIYLTISTKSKQTTLDQSQNTRSFRSSTRIS